MTERLDRIEAHIESTRSDIDTLLGAVSTNEVACRDLRETATENAAACRELRISITENQDRFVVLREEARADRAETRRLFNDAITQVEIDRVEYRRRCDELQRQADEDRRRADDERRRADERHTAQMEVIQTLLLELTKSNGNIGKLRDRVDGLEQAS
jgi:hypothetical protein